ncbi:hypothetical protein CCR98_07865 [Stenotrophomonas sp. WZN-1]|nr:hypothetical protein CCR98_07865 [Stenotrophomonas sp. WZN-1]
MLAQLRPNDCVNVRQLSLPRRRKIHAIRDHIHQQLLICVSERAFTRCTEQLFQNRSNRRYAALGNLLICRNCGEAADKRVRDCTGKPLLEPRNCSLVLCKGVGIGNLALLGLCLLINEPLTLRLFQRVTNSKATRNIGLLDRSILASVNF